MSLESVLVSGNCGSLALGLFNLLEVARGLSPTESFNRCPTVRALGLVSLTHRGQMNDLALLPARWFLPAQYVVVHFLAP